VAHCVVDQAGRQPLPNRRCSRWRAESGGWRDGGSLRSHQPIVLPAVALVGGLVTAAIVGTVAGAYPAVRAARLTPTEALRSP